MWSTTASPGSSFTLIACESVKYTGFPQLAAEGPATADSTTTTSSSSTTTRRTTGTTDTGTSTTGTGTRSGGGVVDPTQTAAPSDNSQPAPVGAIVGGVVGGLAVLALAAVALVFFLRSRKPKEAAPPNGLSGPAPYGSPPPQSMVQHQQTPPGFPPNPSPYSASPYTAYNTTPSPTQAYNNVGAAPGGLYPGAGGVPYQPASPDPSKHYSHVSSEPGYGAYGTPPPQQQQQQSYNAYQPPQIAEMGATNPSGSYGNRAELG